MIELAERPLDDRTVQVLLTDVENDGGQFDSKLAPFLSLGTSLTCDLVVVNM